MDLHQASQIIQKVERQRSVPKYEKARPQDIQKEPLRLFSRKSARLAEIQALQERTVSKDRNTEPKHPLPTPTSNTPGKEFPQVEDQKLRRSQESNDSPNPYLGEPVRKQQRTSFVDAADNNTCEQDATSSTHDSETNPIDYWREKGRWPEEYFIQDDQTRTDFRNNFEEDSWYEEYLIPEVEMNHLFARKKFPLSLRGSGTPSDITPSDERPRALKSGCYLKPKYIDTLATKGSFMEESELGITDEGEGLCRNMLSMKQTMPRDTLFRDDLFGKTCAKLQGRNETKVIHDITRLIVPSAETLATFGAKNLEVLIESLNEGWNNSIPVTVPRPQPDYSVGFRRKAFTEDQLNKLKPFVGENTDTSFFMATYYLYFPFLTCEVKCGAAALDIADRQNAHSMTIAVRSVVELFKLVRREKELHREILAFSISHDNEMVRIYGHYPMIDGKITTFYRHPIRKFDFTDLNGREKWTAHQFIKNVYEIWMPTHLKKICSAIDDLPPNLNFEIQQQSELGGSELSKGLESHHLSTQSSHAAASLEYASQSSRAGSQDITPNTSVPQRI